MGWLQLALEYWGEKVKICMKLSTSKVIFFYFFLKTVLGIQTSTLDSEASLQILPHKQSTAVILDINMERWGLILSTKPPHQLPLSQPPLDYYIMPKKKVSKKSKHKRKETLSQAQPEREDLEPSDSKSRGSKFICSAKPGNKWTEHELHAFNIIIKDEREEEFFDLQVGVSLPMSTTDPTILNNIVIPQTDISDSARKFFSLFTTRYK
jgi:hypothetical protein